MSLTRRHILTMSITAPAAFMLATGATAAEPEIYNEGGLAVGGTDVVAYFTDGQPTAGSADITLDYRGVTWRFASEANRDAFIADPAAYMPQYGGYCAYAVSRGYTASTVREAWTIVDGKLYLNYSTGVRSRWERDVQSNIAMADANWPAVLG